MGVISLPTSLRDLMKALEIKWEYHTPWHPPSSWRVERMNQILKNQLTKLVLETRLPWIKCLPIALLRIKTAPQKETWAMLFHPGSIKVTLKRL
jgi:hypothetical protein